MIYGIWPSKFKFKTLELQSPGHNDCMDCINNCFSYIVNLLNLNVAIEAFDAHGLRGQNDKVLDIADMITVLSSLYETISASHPTTVNVPLCLDLTINWLLNVYDW